MGLLIVSLFFITVWSFSENIVSYFYEKNVYEVCIHKNAMNKLMFIRKQKKKKQFFICIRLIALINENNGGSPIERDLSRRGPGVRSKGALYCGIKCRFLSGVEMCCSRWLLFTKMPCARKYNNLYVVSALDFCRNKRFHRERKSV